MPAHLAPRSSAIMSGSGMALRKAEVQRSTLSMSPAWQALNACMHARHDAARVGKTRFTQLDSSNATRCVHCVIVLERALDDMHGPLIA